MITEFALFSLHYFGAKLMRLEAHDGALGKTYIDNPIHDIAFNFGAKLVLLSLGGYELHIFREK